MTALNEIHAVAARRIDRDVTCLSCITKIDDLARADYATSRDPLMLAIVAIAGAGWMAATDRMTAIAEITKRTVPVDPWDARAA